MSEKALLGAFKGGARSRFGLGVQRTARARDIRGAQGGIEIMMLNAPA